MQKIILFSLSLVIMLFGFSSSFVYARSDTVIFVKQVSKSCKHLGSVSHAFEGEKLYSSREGFKVVPAGPVFADEMKMKAKKMGANRLVLVEVFNNKKVMSGMGHHEWITQSEYRARAFKC